MLSIVTVSEASLVIRIADCRIDGGLLSDQIRASSQKPSVELMQLLVCACETAARIAFTATANISQTARFIPSLIRRQLPRYSARQYNAVPRGCPVDSG